MSHYLCLRPWCEVKQKGKIMCEVRSKGQKRCIFLNPQIKDIHFSPLAPKSTKCLKFSKSKDQIAIFTFTTAMSLQRLAPSFLHIKQVSSLKYTRTTVCNVPPNSFHVHSTIKHPFTTTGSMNWNENNGKNHGKKDNKQNNKQDDKSKSLDEKTKKMLNETISLVEKTIKELDDSVGGQIKQAEKSLGAEGFFDRLKTMITGELKQSHQRVG